MPNWSPNWNDVRWNWGAANAAADALRRGAAQLDSTTDARTACATVAQAEWRGGHRESFDGELRTDILNFRSLAQQMRDAAARIDDASRQARDEQSRRERDRERWRRERDRERAEEERRKQDEERRRRRP